MKAFFAWLLYLAGIALVLFGNRLHLPHLSGEQWVLLLGVGLPLWSLVFVFFRAAVASARAVQKAGQTIQQNQNPLPAATLSRPGETVGARMAELGGIEDARQSLAPVVAWLRSPTGVLGDAVPRAVLVTGASGCGKTTLARAVAGETGVPLFSYSGAEFHELLIGMGSARMREVFAEIRREARQDRPAVLFIDQIDLLATERPAVTGPGSAFAGEQEAHRTLAQLMSEMDNLELNGRVFVIAATSRPRVLDPALFLPGRFGLRVDLPLPAEEQRVAILGKHLGDRPLEGITMTDIARGTGGFTGAELAQLVRWAVTAAKDRLRVNDRPLLPGQPLEHADFVQAKAKILPQVDGVPPARILDHLDLSVQGQAEAKQRLAVAVSNHYLRLSAATTFTDLPIELRKSNVLVTGPTGTGKTMLVETIAEFLGVPSVIGNATVLTETGYQGTDVRQLLYQLLVASDFNLRRAEYGIICVDEFDKLAFNQGERTRTTGATVQQELLKLVEGTRVEVAKSGGRDGGDSTAVYQLDTHNILFICLGAFNGLDRHVAARLGTPAAAVLPGQALPEDFVSYGFLPELVGRFPVITATEALSERELIDIMSNPRNGLIAEYRSLLNLQGWENPVFTSDALLRIAIEAHQGAVGARALRSILERVLGPTMVRRPDHDGPQLIVDGELIERELGKSGVSSSAVARATTLTPRKVESALAEKVPGSRDVQELLAVLSCRHYRDPADRSSPVALVVDPYLRQRRSLTEALAEIWGVPWAVLDATQLAEGDAGQWYASAVTELTSRAGHRPASARYGILLCDNVDRALANSTAGSIRTGFQRAIAPLLAGQPVSLASGDGTPTMFPTAGLLPVLAGDFRLTARAARQPALNSPYVPRQLLPTLAEQYTLPENLLVGVTDLRLGEDDLVRLIRNHDEDLRGRYRPLLEFRHLVLHRSEHDYQRLAHRARREAWTPADIPVRLETILMEQLSGDGHRTAADTSGSE
ncbi:MAG TPA: AAA family ATPase [Amycolatopsis sp.]|uniref:AAA family ATPase n=1 Tax=Amycolatopsis sp. TaxID=37632 RepID=UPI002B46AE9E|nr:AAA family ATPase [Amycolatopsis sp.]HKS48264.1 AAA family ATPase [Amycolatopsis sp.]